MDHHHDNRKRKRKRKSQILGSESLTIELSKMIIILVATHNAFFLLVAYNYNESQMKCMEEENALCYFCS